MHDIPHFGRGHIIELLRKDSTLLHMTQVFYQAFELANPHRHVRCRELPARRMDALARLLVGDETCTAIAWDKTTNKLNICSNNNEHSNESIRLFVASIIEPGSCFFPQKPFSFALMRSRLRVTFTISKAGQPPKVITKHYENLISYAYDPSRDVLIKLASEPKTLIFKISPAEHQLHPHHMLSFALKIKQEIPNIRQRMYDEDIARILIETYGRAPVMEAFEAPAVPLIAIPFPTPFTDLNPLRRRINTLFQHFSMLTWIVKEERSSYPNRERIIQAKKAAIDFRNNVFNQTLTWEASTWYKLNKGLRTHADAKSAQFITGMERVIYFLNNHLNDFKKRVADLSRPTQYIKSWINTILSDEGIVSELKRIAPELIAQDLEKFFERAKRTFIDLEKMEHYISNSFDDPHGLWPLFDDLNIFNVNDVNARYEIFDTKENNLHAEMRLLNYYAQKQKSPGYIGITKLCCAHCNWVIQRFPGAGFSGGHARAYIWTFPEFLLQDAQLKILFGDSLFEEYKGLADETISLYQKTYKKSDAFLGIIAAIASLNEGDIRRFSLGTRKLQHNEPEHADESDDDLSELSEHSVASSLSIPTTASSSSTSAASSSSSSSSSVVVTIPADSAPFSSPLSPYLLRHTQRQEQRPQETLSCDTGVSSSTIPEFSL